MEYSFVDLTLDIYNGAPTFEEDPKCAIVQHSTIKCQGSNCTQISLSSHHGTHLDSPLHFIEQGESIDKIACTRFIGEAVLLDFSYKKSCEAIEIKDFKPYEKYIKEGAKIVYKTGFDKVYPNKGYFTDFPFLTKEAADWLSERKIALLGMDTPTPNPVDFDYVHKSLLGAEIVILEGLANLDGITKPEFLLMAAPLKIRNCDAAPVRAIAIVV